MQIHAFRSKVLPALALLLLLPACGGHGGPASALSTAGSLFQVDSEIPRLAGSDEAALLTIVTVSENGEPRAGQAVALAIEGQKVRVDARDGVTNDLGRWETRLRSSEPGPIKVQALARTATGDVAIGTTKTILFRSLASPGLSQLDAMPRELWANGHDEAKVTLEVRDAIGQPISGLAVKLVLESPTPSSMLTGTTNAAGLFAGTYRTAQAGVRVVKAEVIDHGTRIEVLAAPTLLVRPALAPHVVGVACFRDVNDNRVVDAGDELIVPFDRDVVVDQATASDFTLPVAGDSLGVGARVGPGSSASEVMLTLGQGAFFSVRGAFAKDSVQRGAPSGIDVSSQMRAGAIRALGSEASAEPSQPADVLAGLVGTVLAAAPKDVSALALGRCDADALPDLVLGRSGADEVRFNQGRGAFASSGQQLAGGETRALLLADLNSDGKCDLVTAESGAHQVWLGLAQPRGQLVPGTGAGHRFGNTSTRAAALADLDGDGDLDIVAAHDAGLQVWKNRGGLSSGEFTAGPALSQRAYLAVAVTDLDRDGRADVVAGGPNGVESFRGLGGAVFAPAVALAAVPCRALAVADLNGDAALDVIVGSEAGGRVLHNDTHGHFVASNQVLGAGPIAALALLDVDGDGDLDLALGNASADPEICLNNGSGSLVAAFTLRGAGATTALLAADIDLDGDLDLIGAGSAQGVSIWKNGTPGPDALALRFERVQVGGTEAGFSLAVGDIDRDGDLDLVLGLGNGGSLPPWEPIQVWRCDGKRGFTRVQLLAAGNCWGLKLFDVDGDGDLDLVSTVQGGWLNDGQGGFTSTSFCANHIGGITALETADFDRDGSPDLVTDRLLLHQPTSVAPYYHPSDTQGLGMPNYVSRIAVGDFDANGWLDAAFTVFDDDRSKEIGVARNRGRRDGFDTTAVAGSGTVSGWRSVATADIDNDGALDLIQGPGPAGTLFAVWRNDGSGMWPTHTVHGTSAAREYVSRIVPADLDADGDIDLVVARGLGLAIWLNDGQGNFNLNQVLDSNTTIDVVVADLDHDGLLDIVAAQPGHAARVWFGRR